jgi:soluble lytic murein transglycosylase-like protein
MSCLQYSHADEITTYLSNNKQSDYWAQYIYNHQTSREKISMATAEKITHAVIIASANYGVNVSLILSVMATESGFNPNARSRSGAIGLMQVVPYWHRKEIAGRDLFNIETAVDVGTEIIQHKLKQARGRENVALAMYCGYRGKSAWKYISTVHKNRDIITASVDSYRRRDNSDSYKPFVNSINYAGNINFKTYSYVSQYG